MVHIAWFPVVFLVLIARPVHAVMLVKDANAQAVICASSDAAETATLLQQYVEKDIVRTQIAVMKRLLSERKLLG